MMGDFDTSHQDAYNRLLASRPEREDPGLARRIVAAGMSVGMRPGDVKDPLQTQEEVMYAPHMRAMKDWSDQVEPAYRSAQLENTSNANERQMRSSYMTNQTNMQRYQDMNDQATRRNDITQANNERKNSIQEKKNQAEDAWRRGYTFSVVGNKLMAHSPDGDSYEAGEAADYDPLTIAKYKHKYTMDEIGKRTEGSIEIKNAIPGYNPANPAGRGGQTPEKQFEERRNMILTQALDSDEFKEFVQPPSTANGLWQLVPPKKPFWGDVDPAKMASFKKLQQAIYGQGQAGGSSQSAPGTPPASIAKPPDEPGTGKPDGAGLGPTKAPEKYQQRQEYGGPPAAAGEDNTPWIAKPFKPAIAAIKEHITKGAAGTGESGLPPAQVMTPDGPKTVPAGETPMTEVATGTIGFIPNDKVAAAEASGKYKKVK
jgi:hypothetical protein